MKLTKVLITATIAKHILRFHTPYLKWFKENGFITYVACAGEEEIPYCDFKYEVPFVRSPYSFGHLEAYKVLKKILDNEDFQLIHCHTPMASVVTRLAARNARAKGTKVLYTAHGFHFYKGSPVFNWLTYYPMEVLLSPYADGIITINKEDFNVVKRWPFNARSKFFVNGMGVNGERFKPIPIEEKLSLRRKYGLGNHHFVLIYVGEFIERKNHEFIVRIAPILKKEIPNIKVLFAGRGVLLEKMQNLARELSVEGEIDFLGFRNDVEALMQLADVGVSASKHEGLPLNIAEEMLSGLPIVAAEDRGHRELVEPGVNGFLYRQNDQKAFVAYIKQLANNENLRNEFGVKSVQKAKKFTLSNSLISMAGIYKMYI